MDKVKKMVVEDKIQDAKDCFDEIVKSGYNSYQKYKYLELYDLNPIVRKVCGKFKLRTNFDWNLEENIMYLKITDKEDKSEYIANIPTAPITASDPGKYMQDVGRVQTYAQRYLYIQVFEIATPDGIDNRNQKTKVRDVSHLNKKTPKPKPVPQPIKQEEEPTEEDIKTALDTIYNIIVIEGGAEFTLEKALFQLQRKYKDKPQLIAACEKSLKTNTAQQVKEGANPKHD